MRTKISLVDEHFNTDGGNIFQSGGNQDSWTMEKSRTGENSYVDELHAAENYLECISSSAHFYQGGIGMDSEMDERIPNCGNFYVNDRTFYQGTNSATQFCRR